MKKISTNIGRIFAHLQSVFDELLDFGFKKMKEAGGTEEKKEDSGIKRGAKAVLGFLGDVGESFYDAYEKIKAEKVSRRKNAPEKKKKLDKA
ncbi:hypothetical protein KJ632_02400 [Patescibacteria group bacterium]|nr:hypothetical protein [Patescibacteria group bacterium]